MIKSKLDHLKFEPKRNEPVSDRVLRAELITLLGKFGDNDVVTLAKKRFALFQKDPKSLAGDLRPALLSVAGTYATREEYDELSRLARAAALEEDRRILLNALCLARSPEISQKTLQLSLGGTFPAAEAARIVPMISGTGVHAQMAWDFMQAHYRKLMELVQGPFENAYAGATVSGFTDDAHAAEYVEFVHRNFQPDALDKAEEAADHIPYCAYMKRNIAPGIERWTQASR